jgi:hypothetical protein
MTDDEIVAAIHKLNATWDEMRAAPDEDVAHGGSPFEWLDERLSELMHECTKRGLSTEADKP